jgi:hypothetical protein
MNKSHRSALRSWFELGLRLLGFWQLLIGASYFLTTLNISMGLTKTVTGSTSFGSYATETFGHLILAMWLLKAAPSIALFFYPEKTPSDDATPKPLSENDTPPI